MTAAFLAIVRRDARLAIRRLGDAGIPLVFFAMVCSLFPLAISPDASVLRLIGPGVVWVAALLAVLMALTSMFREDFSDGSMELMLLSGQPLSMVVYGKILVHWLMSGLPLILLAPLFAVSFRLPMNVLPVLVLALALGTLTLTLVGSIGAALTANLRQSNAILSLLVLPLIMPVLIFGARAVVLAIDGMPSSAALYWMAAVAVLSATLAPFAAATALRISNE